MTRMNLTAMLATVVFSLVLGATILASGLRAADNKPATRPTTDETVLKVAQSYRDNVDSFVLQLLHAGNQDKPFYTLTLTVAEPPKQDDGFNRVHQISKDTALKLIDRLRQDGFFGRAKPHVDIPANASAYILRASAGATQLEENLGWDLRTAQRLDDLVKLMDGEPAKSMEALIGRLTGLRKVWEAEAARLIAEQGITRGRLASVAGLQLEVTAGVDSGVRSIAVDAVKDTKVTLNGKDAKLTELTPGQWVVVDFGKQLNSNRAAGIAATTAPPQDWPVEIRIVSSMDAEDDTRADPWIVAELARLGIPDAQATSQWIAIGPEMKEVYRTMQGGRVIRAKVGELSKISPVPQRTVTIDGLKIGNVPRQVSVLARAGEGTVVKLTDYPEPPNVYVAVRIGEGPLVSDAAARMTQFRMAAQKAGNVRIGIDDKKLGEEALDAAIAYLASHLDDPTVAKYGPELGFTHIGVTAKLGDDGVLILIETADRDIDAFRGGLNIRYDAQTGKIDRVDNRSRRPVGRGNATSTPVARAETPVYRCS